MRSSDVRGAVKCSRVCVVQEDADSARVLQHILHSAGFSPITLRRVDNIIAAARRETPALILLDVMLPEHNGIELCRQLRKPLSPFADTPVIFLTASVFEEDRIRGLAAGADDYITKPFSPGELIARIKAVLRRYDVADTPELLKKGDLEIDSATMTISVGGEAIMTTATEFKLMHYLAQHSGRTFTRSQLFEAIWIDKSEMKSRTVDGFVHKLRKKIELDGRRPQYLKTVRGAGYRFDAWE